MEFFESFKESNDQISIQWAEQGSWALDSEKINKKVVSLCHKGYVMMNLKENQI